MPVYLLDLTLDVTFTGVNYRRRLSQSHRVMLTVVKPVNFVILGYKTFLCCVKRFKITMVSHHVEITFKMVCHYRAVSSYSKEPHKNM